MKHPHRISDIAARAGLSTSTVDRVLNRRGTVRESTSRAVHEAIADLDRESSPARPTQIDVIAPGWASAALADAVSATIRIRFDSGDPVEALTRAARSRTQGVLLQAAESTAVIEAAARLSVPVVTCGNDLPAGKRVAHVGVDRAGAGATAAYLVQQWMADRAGEVLTVGAPASGFEAEMRVRAPNRRLHAATGPAEVRDLLAERPAIRAVYSTLSSEPAISAAPVPGAGTAVRAAIATDAEAVTRGEVATRVGVGAMAAGGAMVEACGGNVAVVGAFAAAGRNYDVFVVHDVGGDDSYGGNLDLLRGGRISAVLRHDARADLRLAFRVLLRALGVLPGPVRDVRSAVQVITPFNSPPEDF